MNGAQWLVRSLASCGVERVFVLCGNGLDPFLDACLDYRLEILDVRNEQAAAYMADTWGRMTRKLGVVAVSSGPGHTNALTGLANSWWDGGPMLLISGCSEHGTRGRDNFQEIDQIGMASPICKYARMVHSIDTLPADTERAIRTAVAGRPGPVHLSIPVDVLSADMGSPPGLPVRAEVDPCGEGEAACVRRAVDVLGGAERPVAVAGSGAFYADAGPELKAFVQATGIPLYSLLWDRGCIEEKIPQYVGIVSTEVNAGSELIAEADVILTIGARIDYRLGFGKPPAVADGVSFVRIDADPGEIARGTAGAVSIVGSPKAVLSQMTDEAYKREWTTDPWLSRIKAHRRASLDFWDSVSIEDGIPMPSLRLCRELKPFLDDDVTFLLDGGNIGRWAHLHFFDRHPAHWFTCGISGVVGWGIPGAVAAKLARPARPLLLLSGDGSAGFTLGDIQTAVRFGISYVAVVAHDAAWGIVAEKQPAGRLAGSRLGEIRFDRVAHALGARGVFIDEAGKIAPAIVEALRSSTPTFIHVPTIGAGISTYRNRLRADAEPAS